MRFPQRDMAERLMSSFIFIARSNGCYLQYGISFERSAHKRAFQKKYIQNFISTEDILLGLDIKAKSITRSGILMRKRCLPYLPSQRRTFYISFLNNTFPLKVSSFHRRSKNSNLDLTWNDLPEISNSSIALVAEIMVYLMKSKLLAIDSKSI